MARWQAALGALGPVAVALLLPDPRLQLALLRDIRADVVLGAVSLLVATLVVWALVGWAALVGCAAVAGRLPGSAGLLGRRVLHAITPAALRRVVIAAAGLSLAAGLGACGSGGPAAGTTSAAAVIGTAAVPTPTAHGDLLVDLDWPLGPTVADNVETGAPDTGTPHTAEPVGTEGVDTAPVTPPVTVLVTPPVEQQSTMTEPPPNPLLQRAADAPARPPDDAVPTAASTAETIAGEESGSNAATRGAREEVLVRRGDSLWSIAAAQLTNGASAAQIDASWRAWYAANRDLIGPDPNLILPGQRLSPPRTPTTPRQEAHAPTDGAL